MKAVNLTEEKVLSLAREAYKSGEAAFDINPAKCALLVIDMQIEFVQPYLTPYWVPEATRQIPKIKQLIDFCRNKNIPVIYTVFSGTNNYLDRPKTGSFMPNRYNNFEFDWSKFFHTGNIHEEIQPLENEIIINKPSYGAFFDTPLETILRNLEKDTVIICGTLTNFCCGTTARQAYERSFKVVFGSDITSTDDNELQEAELKVLRKGFARVLSSEKIMANLQSFE
jgi:nicotinamidase-related amidase